MPIMNIFWHLKERAVIYIVLYPKGAGDRSLRRLTYSLVDGFVGHLRNEFQVDF
jgi:hypothetical protein